MLAGIATGCVVYLWQVSEQNIDPSWMNHPINLTANIEQASPNGHAIKLRLTQITRDDGVILDGKADVYWWPKVRNAAFILPGQQIHVSARLHPPHQRQNPGGFDYTGMLLRQHVVLSGSLNQAPEVIHSETSWIEQLRQRIRLAMPKNDTASAILSALLLAEKDQIPTEMFDAFADTGTAHLLAISGMHLGMVAGWCYLLLWWLLTRRESWIIRLPVRQVALWGSIAGAGAYATLAGWPLPTQRAGLLLLSAALAWSLREHYRPLHTLTLALFVITIIQPTSVLSVSLWMSFVAAAALLIWADHPSERTPSTHRSGWSDKLLKAIRSLILITVLAGLATLPIVADVFGRIPIWSIPANFILVNLYALWVLPLALLGEIAALLDLPTVAQWLMQLATQGISLGNGWLQWLAQLPLGKLRVPDIPLWLSLLYGVGLLCAVWLWMRHKTAASIAVLSISLLLFLSISSIESRYETTQFIAWDAGQGAASTLLLPEGQVVVIDSPGRHGSRFNGGTTVADGLRHLGLSHADVIIASHAQSDHAGGLLRLIEQLNRTGELWLADIPDNRNSQMLQEIIAALHKRGGSVRWLQQGERIIVGQSQFHVLWPDRNTEAPNSNNTSLVLSVTLPDRQTLLLPGDIEKPVEAALLNSYSDDVLHHDILLIPHHGSQSSSTMPWVTAVHPTTVIVQSGFSNHFGFPQPQIIARYLSLESTETILNTAHGAVIGKWTENGPEWYQFEDKNLRKRNAALQWVTRHL